jgi:hypothetical protein
MTKLTIEHVFGTIVPAWQKVFFHDPETERIALERGNVCLTCEFRGRFVRSKRWGDKCTKIRARENGCPAKKWKE